MTRAVWEAENLMLSLSTPTLKLGKGSLEQATRYKRKQQKAHGIQITIQKNLEDVFWLGTDVNVLNSGGYNWKVDVEEEVNKRLKEKEVMFMSTEPVAMKLGPMSGGDLKTMKALLESLNIAYAEKDGYLTTVKISKGDQPTILAKAEELQIGYTPYCDATDELKHKINL